MTLTRTQGAVVIDASVAVPFLKGDPAWHAFMADRIAAGDMLLAPSHFGAEVANGLLRGTTLQSVDRIVDLMRQLWETGVTEVAMRPLALEDAIRLADRHRLTVYDAAYLNLAIDVDALIATNDDDIRRAAAAEGVPVAGERELGDAAEGERWARAVHDPEFPG